MLGNSGTHDLVQEESSGLAFRWALVSSAMTGKIPVQTGELLAGSLKKCGVHILAGN